MTPLGAHTNNIKTVIMLNKKTNVSELPRAEAQAPAEAPTPDPQQWVLDVIAEHNKTAKPRNWNIERPYVKREDRHPGFGYYGGDKEEARANNKASEVR